MAKPKVRGHQMLDRAKATWLMHELFNTSTPFSVDYGKNGEYIIATINPDHQYVIQELLTRSTTTEVVSVEDAIDAIKEAIEVACDDMDVLRQIILQQYPMNRQGQAVIEAEVDDDNEWVTLYYETNDEDDPEPKTLPLTTEPKVRKAG